MLASSVNVDIRPKLLFYETMNVTIIIHVGYKGLERIILVMNSLLFIRIYKTCILIFRHIFVLHLGVYLRKKGLPVAGDLIASTSKEIALIKRKFILTH